MVTARLNSAAVLQLQKQRRPSFTGAAVSWKGALQSTHFTILGRYTWSRRSTTLHLWSSIFARCCTGVALGTCSRSLTPFSHEAIAARLQSRIQGKLAVIEQEMLGSRSSFFFRASEARMSRASGRKSTAFGLSEMSTHLPGMKPFSKSIGFKESTAAKTKQLKNKVQAPASCSRCQSC